MPPADLIFNLQFFDFAVERREAEPKDISGVDLVIPPVFPKVRSMWRPRRVTVQPDFRAPSPDLLPLKSFHAL